MKNKIFITTAIDYANDVIHVGHAYQKVLADALARFFRLTGREVFFLTGTDEHGANIEKKAKENNKKVQEYVDSVSGQDKEQIAALGVVPDRFIRTTDADHKEVVKDFWNKIYAKGEIYSKSFEGMYCMSCEAFKNGDEIVDGCCDVHKNLKLVEHKENNYFFQWSKYQSFLTEWFKKNPQFVLPEGKYKEMKSFLAAGVEDISISRQNVSWGIPVPNDPAQVIYVWFDALISYYTAGTKTGFWDDDVTIIHVLGKDNLRWHALLWPAMLQAADLKLPDIVYAHSFININGQKVSKTLGNIIRPTELVDEFGTDAVRYFFLKRGPLDDDVDISLDKIKEVYNADLANGLGNLVQRVSKICQSIDYANKNTAGLTLSPEVATKIENFKINEVIEDIQARIGAENRFIENEKLWQKTGEALEKDLDRCITNIRQIVYDLSPVIPTIAVEIEKRLSGQVVCGEPLFARIK
ncbi:MAG: methionine--tRNA ligase [Patescibacteria group bacterium]|jgi:methionyl-tRNA synthetase